MVTTVLRPMLPWAVWGTAVLAYVVAVVNRSSLASLGPATQEHFGVDATTLAGFAVIQLVVYAAMQIPVGVLLDRFGATVLILTGGVLMMLGQLAMATVHDVSLAILARVLVGAGDACTFISVMRMLPEWFSVRQLPTVGQITGMLGQAGQLISVTPLAMAVAAFGWATGFVGVAAVGLIVVLLGAVVLRDRPGQGTLLERVTGRLGSRSRGATSLGQRDSTTALNAVAPPETALLPVVEAPVRRRVPGTSFWRDARRLLSIPGVRLAYWVHFTTPFSVSTFVLLWGTPFLTGGIGLSRAAAGGLLSLTIVSSMIAGVLLGPISSRFVEKRVWLPVVVCVLIVCNWLLVLLWPGEPPLVRSAMTCSAPLVEEALPELRAAGVTRLFVLPLYPQYSVTTTKGSFARVAEALARMGWSPERVNAPDAWYSEPRFLDAHAARIEAAAAKLPDPDPSATVLLYSAHSLPVSTVEKRKDPYPRQVEECCALIDARLGRRFRSRLGYQSKLGPVAWLGPSTGEVLAELAKEGARQVVVCPVAFVSDHVETLYEIRMLFADEARALGIPHYVAADGLNDHPDFIQALADVSRKALLPAGAR